MYKDSRWYLVQCKPRDSFRAALHLQNQNYECFHPTHLVKRKRTGVVQSVLEPLFPYYLFILLNANDNWSKIHSTRGVSRMVKFNGIPASIDNHIIEGLQLHCAKLNGLPPEPMFKKGDHVMITDGCFKQLEAIVTATTGEERVVLLLNLFNREQSIELSVNGIELVA